MFVSVTQLRVAMTVDCTEAEGPGRRFSLWVQGCPFRCPGCCNPEFLDVDAEAELRTVEELDAEIARAHARRDLEGVSLLGGEPFLQAPALAQLAARARARGLSVMVYSGYTLAELEGRSESRPAPEGAAALLAETDLLVDGRYVEKLRTTKRTFIGSTNQELHFLTDRYAEDDPRLSAPNTLELRMVGGKIIVNGFPILGADTRVGSADG
jgi:anaerobic ribonucleoside-triphosphate reductase activating protein